jgi:hypothetical protein
VRWEVELGEDLDLRAGPGLTSAAGEAGLLVHQLGNDSLIVVSSFATVVNLAITRSYFVYRTAQFEHIPRSV